LHDVLAHRLSLLSVHAGALEFHPDAPAEQVAAAAGVIRESARAALDELRGVIGVLPRVASGAPSTSEAASASVSGDSANGWPPTSHRLFRC
jgi:signal transduction histidine kinase